MAKSKPGITRVVKTPLSPPPNTPEHPYWKKAFYICLLLFTCIVVYSGYDTGFHSDEMDMNAYGKANWKYLASFGKDTSYLHVTLENGTPVPAVIKTYGGFFEFINSCVNKVTGPFFGGEYNTRHLLCQLMGMLAIWFAGLISVSLSGRYLFGLICMTLLYLTPTFFGHMMFNTKDIPFTLGYTMCIYGMILFMKQKQVFHVAPFIFITIGLAASIGTRIGGLVLLVYVIIAAGLKLYDLYKKKGTKSPVFKKQVLFLCLSLAAGFVLAILPWPFVLSSPIENIRYALQVATKFPQRIPFIFEGVFTDSLSIPPHYLPKWMSITIPVYIILLFAISLLALLLNFRKPGSRFYIFILFTVLFPIIYAIQTKAALYSAWRHLLFVYPVLVVFAVYSLTVIKRFIKTEFAAYIVCGFSFAGMTHPVKWSLKNHPYEYLYFNETSGGFAKNYSQYETDYWQLSVREALDWLYKNEHIKGRKYVRIGNNALASTQYMMQHSYGDTSSKALDITYRSKCLVDWNYMILSNLFLEPYIIQNDFYPPFNSMHKIEIEGKTICAIVKDTTRDDFHAFLAISQHQLHLADSLADAYLRKDPGCVKIMEISASAKAEKDDWPACYNRCATGLGYMPENIVLLYYLGIYHANNGQPQKAIMYIEDALDRGYQKSKPVYRILSELYAKLGKTEPAAHYAGLAK